MITILETILTVIFFLLIEMGVYQLTEKHYDKIPAFLQHKPFNCRTCCQFWANIFACAVFWFVSHWTFACTVWLVLAILETIALKIEEGNRYIDDEFYNEDEDEDR